MRVAGSKASQNRATGIRLTIPIRVREVKKVVTLANVSAAITDCETGRHVQAAGENRLFIGTAVAVGVFEDDQLIVRIIGGDDLWVCQGGEHPQPPCWIPVHANGVGDPVGFVGEKIGCVAVRQLEGCQLCFD